MGSHYRKVSWARARVACIRTWHRGAIRPFSPQGPWLLSSCSRRRRRSRRQRRPLRHGLRPMAKCWQRLCLPSSSTCSRVRPHRGRRRRVPGATPAPRQQRPILACGLPGRHAMCSRSTAWRSPATLGRAGRQLLAQAVALLTAAVAASAITSRGPGPRPAVDLVSRRDQSRRRHGPPRHRKALPRRASCRKALPRQLVPRQRQTAAGTDSRMLARATRRPSLAPSLLFQTPMSLGRPFVFTLGT